MTEKEWAVVGRRERTACARNNRDSVELEKREQRGRKESWLPSTYLSCMYCYLLSRVSHESPSTKGVVEAQRS